MLIGLSSKDAKLQNYRNFENKGIKTPKSANEDDVTKNFVIIFEISIVQCTRIVSSYPIASLLGISIHPIVYIYVVLFYYVYLKTRSFPVAFDIGNGFFRTFCP